MHLNKPSEELVIDLINEANGRTFTNVEIDVHTPQSHSHEGRNTRATVQGIEGNGYYGQQTVYYNRLHLDSAMPNNDPEGLELMVPNDGFVDTVELCDRLNRMFNYQLGPDDVIYEPVDASQLPVTVTLKASLGSLAWTGQKVMSLVPDRPMWVDTFSSQVLTGFQLPSADLTGLTEPTSNNNALTSFRTGEDALLFGTGLPAGGFLMTTNSELELSLSARAGAGVGVSVPDSDNIYSLNLLTESTWCLVYSVGRLDAASLMALYDVCIVLTRSDNSSCMLILQQGTEGLEWYCSEFDITVPVEHVSLDEAIVQGRIDAETIRAALLPLGSSGNGAPLGLFTVRMQARRKNSLAPRVMSTVLVKAYNT